MPARSFQLANVFSATLWVPALFAPGYLSAKHLVAKGQADDGSLMLLGLGIGIVFAIASWFYSKAIAARRRARRARGRTS
ncbi:DedA family protein, partial [Escherichia coli]